MVVVVVVISVKIYTTWVDGKHAVFQSLTGGKAVKAYLLS